MILYNADDNDNFNTGIINAVYDNNINVQNFSLFQIQTTLGTSSEDYITYSSLTTPKIKFSPNFYKLRIKLTDDLGNLIIFDNTPYKTTDTPYFGSVIPQSMLNVNCKFVFKQG